MNNEQRDPVEIEADINQTRAHMSKTLDEIQSRLSPGRLLDQALDFLGGKSTDNNNFTANLTESVKQNPIPTTLIGLGLGWLLMADKSKASTETHHYPSSRGPVYTAHNPDRFSNDSNISSHQNTRTSGSNVDHLKNKASTTTAEAKGKISAAADSTKEKIGEVRDSINTQANYQVDNVQQNFRYLLSEQPLVLLGAGLAVGAALGAGLPPTRREDKLMGETRDKLVDQAATVGNAYLDKTKAVASSATNAAAEEADREGFTPETGKNKAEEMKDSTRRIINAGREAAKKEADNQAIYTNMNTSESTQNRFR